MAKAKPRPDFAPNAVLKPECDICFDEEGSYGCVRPAHEAWRNGTKPATKEILATSIVTISDAVKKLYDSGLNRDAVVALIADDTKLGKKTIETILDSLLGLRKKYTKWTLDI